ncbi:MAG TPA: methionyl-tRNA formyltransferase [Opitutae bacterium]|nr:methionyl-tRNA formyltransferase [Opitutae bacterium]
MEKLTLFLMTRKGLSVLRALLPEYRDLITAVVTSRDTSILDDCYDEIVALCDETGIQCYNRSDYSTVESGYALAISWRWLIPASSMRLIVVHDSLLPKYRGFNPLVTALINGDSEIGATALWAAEEYDRGDIIRQESRAISYPIRITDAIEVMSDIYVCLVLEIAAILIDGGTLGSTAQDESAASYSLWRDDDDYCIDWSLPSDRLKRQIDAQGYPYLGSSALIDGKRVRIISAECVEDVRIANRSSGKVIFVVKGRPVVVCGQGLLKVLEVVCDETNESALPLPRYRTRFK